MRARNLTALILVFVITVVGMTVTFMGLKIGDKQLIPSASDNLSLGLDLVGGVYTVFRADRADYSDEEFSLLLDSTQSVLTARLTNEGYTEAKVSRQGTDSIRVEIPGVEEPEEVFELIGKPAHLEFIDPNGSVVIEGKDIRDVAPAYDSERAAYGVSFTLTDEGAKAFEAATARLVGKPIYIVLDGEQISAPVVNEKISGGKGQISLNVSGREQSYREALKLSNYIMSGALPLDLSEEETRSISATLGEDAINRAVIAGIVGAALIFVFMLVMYRLPGLMADIALCWYIMLVFIALAVFKIQLTLPGIAGILLGIGMAVDANVIIFERFREEIRDGKSYDSAVKTGFKNALGAIIDSNVTTLIAAFVLMYFGTGSVRGFSYTLTLSVIMSMISAVFITRFLLKRAVRLGLTSKGAYTRPYSRKKRFSVMKRSKIFALVPAILLLAAILLNLFGAGIKLGIDFTGGTLAEYDLGQDFTTEEVSAYLKSAGQSDFTLSKISEGDKEYLQLRVKLSGGSVDYSEIAKDVTKDINELKLTSTGRVDSAYISENNIDDDLSGAQVFMYSGLFDSDRLNDLISDALDEKGVSYDSVHAYELDDDPENPRTALYIVPKSDSAAGVSAITSLLKQKYPNALLISADFAGAVSSAQLIKNALKSMGAALILMLIYIAIRFDFHSGVAALAGLMHDVIIMLAMMSFFGFLYQINSPFIAALLTIVGYSINDTIVVFDRVRENKKTMAGASAGEIVDESVSQSLSRTINTSITTLLTLLALFILGTGSIREFAFPLIAGMVAGTYSSNLLSGPLWAKMQGRKKRASSNKVKGESDAQA